MRVPCRTSDVNDAMWLAELLRTSDPRELRA